MSFAKGMEPPGKDRIYTMDEQHLDEQSTELKKVIPVDLEKEMKKSFLEYSMSVIVARALPDVRDGLKPVHRRIL